MESGPRSRDMRDNMFAMRLSFGFGLLMLACKTAAWWYTQSAAIFADASESVIHVLAVGFAFFSLHLSHRPANPRFLFGYERIAFFSAGFEGALIVLAAITIIATAISKWIHGIELANLGWGTVVVLAASLVNAALGWYLLRTGKRTKSLILEANGRHVLTDSWTSFGVAAGLCLVLITGWRPFDPLCAIATAINILWSGGRLIYRSVGGLLDYADPAIGRQLREAFDSICGELGLQYHGVRYRHSGHRLLVQVDLLFPYRTPLGEAHRIATAVEERLPKVLGMPVEITSHLESLEDHAGVHRQSHYTGLPER